jgi:predicted phage terminase large subunit-like protein
VEIEEFTRKYLDWEILPHQKVWVDHFENNRWSLLLAPRGHGKSSTMTMYVTWKICTSPDLRVLIAAHKEQEANVFARNIQRAFEIEEIQHDFGIQPGKPWRVGFSFFEQARHPTIRTVATEAGITGARFDIAVFDDLLTEMNQATEKRREKLKSWIWGEVLPALDPGPRQKIIVVGTRKHVEDWYSEIFEMPDFKVRVDRVYDDAGNYLWPEQYNEEEVERLRRNWPPEKFAREFLNSPFAPAGLKFKRDWLKFYKTLPEDRYKKYYMGIDLSMGSTKERSSYFAAVVIAFDWRITGDAHAYIVDMIRAKESFAEQLDIIKALYDKWKPETMIVEDGLVNRSHVDQVQEEFPRIQRHNPNKALAGTTTAAKEIRIEQLAGYLFKNGWIYLPDYNMHPMTKIFVEHEFLEFPEGNMDLLDALNMALSRCDVGRQHIRDPQLYMY